MTRDELEFLLSQYHDGSLSEEQTGVAEEILRTDPQAQAILGEYKKLDAALRNPICGAALPAIHWDRLAEHLSGTISDALTRRRFRITPARTTAALAMAACMLLGLAIFWPRTPSGSNRAPVAVAQSLVVVVGPHAEAASGTSVVDISVGRPQEADAAMDYTSAGVVVQHPMVALDAFTGPGGHW